MIGEPLTPSFYEQNALDVAEQLIGCYIVRRLDNGRSIIVQINETEAYRGVDDPASHASRGVTPRNKPMFDQGGKLYVYLTYGMHYCLNIVTETEGQPSAVLLRSAIPVEGISWIREARPNVRDAQLINGPGKLTKGLQIDLSFNRYPLGQDDPAIQLFHGSLPYPIQRTGRIGISQGQDLLWRFVALPPKA